MENELSYNEIKELFSKHTEWENELVDTKSLCKKDEDKSTELIINKLKSKDMWIRYIASHMILTFKLEQAKEMLIQRILNKNTFNRNGTMTYALSHLNCEKYLVDIFKILATQSYESKMHAYSILSDQIFEFTNNDLIKMKIIWSQFQENPKEHNAFSNETIEMVQDGYEGFEAYLRS